MISWRGASKLPVCDRLGRQLLIDDGPSTTDTDLEWRLGQQMLF